MRHDRRARGGEQPRHPRPPLHAHGPLPRRRRGGGSLPEFFALHHFLKKNEQVGTKPTLLLDVTSGGLGFRGLAGQLLFQTKCHWPGRLSVLEHFTEEERVSVMFPSAVRAITCTPRSPRSGPHRACGHPHTRAHGLRGAHPRLAPAGAARQKYPAVIAPEEFLQIVESLMPLTTHKLMQVFDISERRASCCCRHCCSEEVVRTLNIDTILVMNTTFLYGYATWCGAQRISPSAISGEEPTCCSTSRAARPCATTATCAHQPHRRARRSSSTGCAACTACKHAACCCAGALLHETGKFVNLRNYPLHNTADQSWARTSSSRMQKSHRPSATTTTATIPARRTHITSA